MNTKKMNQYIEEAKKTASTSGFDWLILLTHAYHESGGFEKVIGENNYWGLKTPTKSEWTGKAVTLYTHEYDPVLESETEEEAIKRLSKKYNKSIAKISKTKINKKDFWKISLPQTFRDWEKTEDALKFYERFIAATYPEAFKARSNYNRFFKELVNKENKYQYATDPSYSSKLENLYIQLKHKFIS